MFTFSGRGVYYFALQHSTESPARFQLITDHAFPVCLFRLQPATRPHHAGCHELSLSTMPTVITWDYSGAEETKHSQQRAHPDDDNVTRGGRGREVC